MKWIEIPKEEIPNHPMIQIATFHYAQEDVQVFLIPDEQLYVFYILYEVEPSISETVSFIAKSLPEAYKMFEEKFGNPEQQIIDVHSEPMSNRITEPRTERRNRR